MWHFRLKTGLPFRPFSKKDLKMVSEAFVPEEADAAISQETARPAIPCSALTRFCNARGFVSEVVALAEPAIIDRVTGCA
jgi:hypothetical protein